MNWVSAKSALQILAIKGECTFLFLNLLIIGSRNSSANYFLEIFSFSSVPPEAFLSKKL